MLNHKNRFLFGQKKTNNNRDDPTYPQAWIKKKSTILLTK